MSTAMGGCVQQRLQNDLVNVAPDQIKEATLKAETPAGISTAEFKELGDTKRAAVMQRLVERTWGDACKNGRIIAAGYSQSGNSNWRVGCGKGSQLPYDYIVSLPERSSGDARVLQCYRPNPRQVTCSVIGKPES
jgi:hypothetical protein